MHDLQGGHRMAMMAMPIKELAMFLFAFVVVASFQAQETYSHLPLTDGWVLSVIFGLVYAVIGGGFGVRAAQYEHKKVCLNELLPPDSPLRTKSD